LTDACGPIGIFDSGVGGLSVLLEIRRALPAEDLVYVADSAYAPYGDKPADVIRERAAFLVEFLVGQGAKAIVVACNTATGVAVDALRAQWRLPIVGIEPAVKPAATATRTGVVGVLATSQTIASARFARLIETWGQDVTVLAQACPGLVEQVERGELSSDATRALVATYVRPLVERGADTLVLGCTHYPLLAQTIAAVAGPHVTILDPAAAVARQVRRRLAGAGLLAPAERVGETAFWTTGPPASLQAVLRTLGLESDTIRPLSSGLQPPRPVLRPPSVEGGKFKSGRRKEVSGP
jgi:glutamate racemase